MGGGGRNKTCRHEERVEERKGIKKRGQKAREVKHCRNRRVSDSGSQRPKQEKGANVCVGYHSSHSPISEA